jgi:glycine oxidase
VAAQRIGIAGAGVLGRLLAFTLSRAGHAVQVFDPASGPGTRADSGSLAAGWTAAGMLSPVAELERAGPAVFALGVRSISLWPQIVQSLGQSVDLRLQGSLLLAHRNDAGAAQRVLGLLQSRAQAPYQPQAITQAQLRELEPSVSGPALAWLLPCEGQIHPQQAMQALAAQATAQGVQWHWGSTVTQMEAGVLHVADAAQPLAFDHVFDVRGVGAKPTLPVRGVRGEVFWLHAPGVVLHRPVRLLHPRHSVYMVPRPDGIIVVGASEIESEDLSPVSLRSSVELLSAAHSAMPALAEARVVHSETNLRPALPDNLPVVTHTRLASGAGKTEINGLFRHGWLIAPALVEQALLDLSLMDLSLSELPR